MSENYSSFEEEPVSATWNHTIQVLLGVLLLIGASLLTTTPPRPATTSPTRSRS